MAKRSTRKVVKKESYKTEWKKYLLWYLLIAAVLYLLYYFLKK